MERKVNRTQQGDLGEASAAEWFMSRGAVVLIPFGHSPHFDLVVELDGRLLRIQVKTSTQETETPEGHWRGLVSLSTAGGNQSWNGVRKHIDVDRFDYLFVLTASGRRWLIPAAALEATHALSLGGPKYSEHEIEAGRPIRDIVFGESPRLELSSVDPGEYPSGQRMATVNRPALPSQVRILPPPSSVPADPTKYERKLGKSGQAVINQKRRITIPKRAFCDAGFENGSRVKVRSDGPGRILLEQVELPPWARPD